MENKTDIIDKVYQAINTVENLKSSIFEDYAVWGGETKRSMNNVINRLNDYLNLLNIKSNLEKELKEYKDMIEWMELNSNASLCDYYNNLEN